MQQSLNNVEKLIQEGGKGHSIFFIYQTEQTKFDHKDSFLRYNNQRYEDIYSIYNKSLKKLEKQILEWLNKFAMILNKQRQSFVVVEPLLVLQDKLANSFTVSALIAGEFQNATTCQLYHFVNDEPMNCKSKVSIDGQIYFNADKIQINGQTKDRVFRSTLDLCVFPSTQIVIVEYLFDKHSVMFMHPVIRDSKGVSQDIGELNQLPTLEIASQLLKKPLDVVSRTALALGSERDSLSRLLFQVFVERTRPLIGVCCMSGHSDAPDSLIANLLQCAFVSRNFCVKQKNSLQETAFGMVALRTAMREQICQRFSQEDQEVQGENFELSRAEQQFSFAFQQRQKKESQKVIKLRTELAELQSFYEKCGPKNQLKIEILKLEAENNELEKEAEKTLWEVFQVQQQKLECAEKIRDLDMKFELFFYKNPDIQQKLVKVRKQLKK